MLANLARRRKEYKGLLMQVSMFDGLSTKEVSPNFQLWLTTQIPLSSNVFIVKNKNEDLNALINGCIFKEKHLF